VVSARGGGGEQARRNPGGAGGLDTSTADVAKIHDFMPGAGRTAADRDAAARVMKEMPHRALSGSGGIRREKELR
jgi:hypothetical protein